MAFTSSTQTDTIIGTIKGGLKVVSTTVTAKSTDIDATPITVKPLTRVYSYIPSVKTAGATSGATISFTNISGANRVWMTPVASINGAVIEIISFGM